MSQPKESLPPTNHQTLVSDILNGSRQAENELVDKYYKKLFFILLKQCQHHQLAEDLTQDTFIIVLAKLKNNELKNPEALASFIRSIGVNLLIDYKRKQTRQKTDTDQRTEELIDVFSQNQTVQIEQEKIVSLLHQILQEFGVERDRDVLRYFYIYGKSKPEICEQLRLSPENFDRVIYRARNRLKQALSIKLGIDPSKMVVSTIMTFLIAFLCMLQFYSKNITVVVRESDSLHHQLYIQDYKI